MFGRYFKKKCLNRMFEYVKSFPTPHENSFLFNVAKSFHHGSRAIGTRQFQHIEFGMRIAEP